MTPERPAWVAKVEAIKNARYIGLYDLPDREGPFYVFWQDEVPEEFRDDPRYDNYFGLIWRHSREQLAQMARSDPEADNALQPLLYITGARSIRDAVFSAYEYAPGQFICSRYRHDYVTVPGDPSKMLDGGLAYVRSSVAPTHTMRIVDGVEVFEEIKRD